MSNGKRSRLHDFRDELGYNASIPVVDPSSFLGILFPGLALLVFLVELPRVHDPKLGVATLAANLSSEFAVESVLEQKGIGIPVDPEHQPARRIVALQ